MNSYILMESQAKMPSSMKFGQSDYRRIAIVKVNKSELLNRKLSSPKQIHKNHKTILKIEKETVAFNGKTENCQAAKVRSDFLKTIEELNKNSGS